MSYTDAKSYKTVKAETPTGDLYYTLYYNFEERTGSVDLKGIDLTLPNDEVLYLSPSKYPELYRAEESSLELELGRV